MEVVCTVGEVALAGTNPYAEWTYLHPFADGGSHVTEECCRNPSLESLGGKADREMC